MRRLTHTIYYYYHQIEQDFDRIWQFLSSLTRDHWVSIAGSLGSALIAAVISLYVVYLQKGQQEEKDEKQQNTTEQNKLKYLHFLIEDTYKVITFYDLSATAIAKSYEINPYVIPSGFEYVPHSLNTIANKINQEEYYLLSIRQTKTDKVAEVFQMYNSLNDRYTKSAVHYEHEFPELIKDKDSYEDALDELIESVTQYIIKSEPAQLSGDDKILYMQINALNGVLKRVAEQDLDRNIWLRDSREIYVTPLIHILDPRGQESQRSLMKQAYAVRKKDDSYRSRMYNVVEAVKNNQITMNQLIDSIKVVAEPIKNYALTNELKNNKY